VILKANTASGVAGVEERLRRVRERIADAAGRCGRDPASVTLVGATKGVEADRVRAAVAAGLRDVGENRVQEALPKIRAVGPGPRWHLIGHLQRNKARLAAEHFTAIHSIDSLAIAQAVDRAAGRIGQGRLAVLIEVNIAGEPTKYGVAPEGAAALVAAVRACPHLVPIGLMTVAPMAGPEVVRSVFRSLRQLRDDLRAAIGGEVFRELSMGMSEDFEIAVEEGATIVRIGRAIFGERAG
jgi:pyridoxal phosphate enzyme (YggS family)